MSAKKRTVSTGLLILDERLQCRDQVPEAIIKEYEEGWKNKIAFPPVSVMQVDGELFVTDGFCRVVAAQNVGKSRIEASVTVGNWKDALRAACGANATHGLRRTNADKRKAAVVAIREFPDETSRSLAELVGVSHTYIQSLRESASEKTSAASPAVVAVEPEVSEDADPEGRDAYENELANQTIEHVLDVVSPPGWRCSDCGGKEQRLSDGGNVCRACLCPVDEVVETFPDPVPEKLGAVHAAWGKFIRACEAASCGHVLRPEIDSVTKKLKGLK